jgi:hypothetical protein
MYEAGGDMANNVISNVDTVKTCQGKAMLVGKGGTLVVRAQVAVDVSKARKEGGKLLVEANIIYHSGRAAATSVDGGVGSVVEVAGEEEREGTGSVSREGVEKRCKGSGEEGRTAANVISRKVDIKEGEFVTCPCKAQGLNASRYVWNMVMAVDG